MNPSVLRKLYHLLPSRYRVPIQGLLATPLVRRLPLSMPLVMHIDPCNTCNFKCLFCPTADLQLLSSVQRPRGMMDPALFRKIVDDIGRLAAGCGTRLRILHLYKDGEPLLNRHLPEMIAYARRAMIARVVSTTTNGSLLTDETCAALIDSGLDAIRISVEEVSDEGYRRISGGSGGYESIRSNVQRLQNLKRRRGSALRITVKITDTNLAAEARRTFLKDFGPLCDEVRIDTLMGWSASGRKDFTLGLPVSTGMDGVSPLRERLICPEPFANLAVNVDGSVSVCCVDWSHGTVVGNAAGSGIGDIWNGEALRTFRQEHIAGRRAGIAVCADCQYVRGLPRSGDLDAHAARLERLYGPPSLTPRPSPASPPATA